MELVPAKPFLPMHESILHSLLEPGTFIECYDPDEPAAPYLGAMLDAGWLRYEGSVLTHRFYITEAGRQRLQLQRLGEEP